MTHGLDLTPYLPLLVTHTEGQFGESIVVVNTVMQSDTPSVTACPELE